MNHQSDMLAHQTEQQGEIKNIMFRIFLICGSFKHFADFCQTESDNLFACDVFDKTIKGNFPFKLYCASVAMNMFIH